MDLDKRQWYVNWFFLSLAVVDKFRDSWKEDEWRYRNGTNLCHFIRVLFVWAPLVVALHVALYAGALAALIALPIYWFGLSGYLAVIIALVVLVAVLVAAVFMGMGIGAGITHVRHQMQVSRQKREAQAASKPAPGKKGPSFGEVLWQYAIATKHRICPILNFKTAEVRS